MEDIGFSSAVTVSVEAPAENLIQEITYDGQEIYQLPLSLSENLTKLAHKIDWSKFDEGTDTVEFGSVFEKDEDDEDAKKPAFQQSSWPWDSVRTKLRLALTEMCVLADVLAIAKEKRYMVLDPVQQESPESKGLVQLLAKKRGLSAAAAVLSNGAERLKSSQNEMAKNKGVQDFHSELLRLRQSWRLKKVGNTILGDLSYRSAGSRFLQSGVFEVSKAEDTITGTTASAPTSPSGTISQPVAQSALKVTIPSELDGTAFIQVTIQKDQDILCSTQLSQLAASLSPSNPNSDLPWQRKLEAAQNVLFCKELFAHLAREAVQASAAIPHMVVGQQITASLFPGIQMMIGLVHSTSNERKPSPAAPPSSKLDHNHILEHSLHQLLRQVHLHNLGYPAPHPSSAPLGPSKRRRMAGPQAADRHDLLQMSKSETVLEQIIEQGQHVVLRLRTAFVIDSIAREIRDPLIISHWNALNSPTLSCVKIIIMTHGYDTLLRTALTLHVGHKKLKCVSRDGRVLHMSYEPQELRDLILCQISQHQLGTVQMLARFLSWQVLANSNSVGLGAVEPLGNASSCLLASPSGTRVLAVRCGPQAPQPKVYVAKYPRSDFVMDDVLRDSKWENVSAPFEQVRWEKMEGKNFLNRIELLMATLNNN